MRSGHWIQEIKGELDRLELDWLLRRLTDPAAGGPESVIDLSSNDYLALSRHPAVVAAVQRAAAAGSGASRLVSGNLRAHEDFEEELAGLYPGRSCLLFGSGYLANLGTISALVGRHDWVVSDRAVHASMIDAVILSRARHLRFNHNDCDSLEFCLKRIQSRRRARSKVLILVESVYSMDGDLAPLAELSEIALRNDASLYIDEAHSFAIFGEGGGGLAAAHCLDEAVLAISATASKALGSYGGFVAVPEEIKQYLVNRARPFIYSTGLPPAAPLCASAALKVIRAERNLGGRLLNLADFFRRRLRNKGFNTLQSRSQIIPLLVGDRHRCLELAQRLRELRIIAAAIREPTVPAGTSRLRFSVSLRASREELEAVADTVADSARSLGVL